MRRLTLAFIADFFTSWTGGASLLGFMLGGVLRAAPQQNATVHVLLSTRVLPQAVQDSLPPHVAVPAVHLNHSGNLGTLLALLPDEAAIVFYKDLRPTLDALGVDVVGPSGFDLGSEPGRPWFGYVPDFQHQYLPEYFTQAERQRRDAHFRALVENAAGVFVNSASVAADIARFYPGAARGKRILRFPALYPDLAGALEDRRAETCARLGVQPPFLLSCSQRWMHKQHELLVTAYAEYLKARPRSPLQLVFTGAVDDDRNPAYAATVQALVDKLGLRKRVRHLGLVERADQLQLIAAARALVTASRFEGGPGASGTLEAALLGTTIVASDIEPHRELAFGHSVFFDAGRSAGLTAALLALPRLDEPGPGAVRTPLFDAPQIELLMTASGLQTLAALRSAAA